MEEKERYKIHRYTLQGNEKISFNDYAEHICEHYDFGFEKIKPFNQRIQDLLNQQDKENQQLKQTQEQLAISELEKLKENSWQLATDISQLIDYTELDKIIDSQIKSLKGEK